MTEPTLDHVLASLIPIFLVGANGNYEAARHAAGQLLASYGATGGDELLLSAEIIALTFASLDSLGKSMADPELSISARLRMRSNANALSRAASRNRDALAQARERAPEPQTAAPEGVSLPAAVQKIRDAIVQAAPGLAEKLTQGGQPLSRQQRRFLTRKAEQARAAQEREARKKARLADRTAILANERAKCTVDALRHNEAQAAPSA